MTDLSALKPRMDRAAAKGQELADAIQEWWACDPVRGVPEIAPDGRSWSLVVHIDTQPDLDAWGLIYGEAIHQLRSTLNNALVRLGTAAGNTPAQLKKIQFPIVATEKGWKDNINRIASLPASCQDLIRSMQPIGTRTDQPHALLLLGELSNQDKHHIQLLPDFDLRSLSHNFSLRFENEAEVHTTVPPDTEFFLDQILVDGSVLVEHRTPGAKISEVEGNLKFKVQVTVATRTGHRIGVCDSLAVMWRQVAVILESLQAEPRAHNLYD